LAVAPFWRKTGFHFSARRPVARFPKYANPCPEIPQIEGLIGRWPGPHDALSGARTAFDLKSLVGARLWLSELRRVMMLKPAR